MIITTQTTVFYTDDYHTNNIVLLSVKTTHIFSMSIGHFTCRTPGGESLRLRHQTTPRVFRRQILHGVH